jgi:hypothetical protein
LTVHSNDGVTSVTAASPLNERGYPSFHIGISNSLEVNVDIENQFIQVIANILPPSGDFYFPAFHEFVHIVQIESLPPGMYTVEYDLFNYDNEFIGNSALVGNGTTQFSVVPEPSTALLSTLAFAVLVSTRRRAR